MTGITNDGGPCPRIRKGPSFLVVDEDHTSWFEDGPNRECYSLRGFVCLMKVCKICRSMTLIMVGLLEEGRKITIPLPFVI